MARPAPAEFETMLRFYHLAESVLLRQAHPETDAALDEPEALRLLEDGWATVDACFCRVVLAGQCAIDNACDPTQSTLEFKPEIREALEQYPALKEEAARLREQLARRAERDAEVAELKAQLRHLRDAFGPDACDIVLSIARCTSPEK